MGARCQALEGFMAQVLASSDTPPFPVEEFPARIHRATVLRADALLAKMADETPDLASIIRKVIDESEYGPFLEEK